jgi:propanediol utilization protein
MDERIIHTVIEKVLKDFRDVPSMAAGGEIIPVELSARHVHLSQEHVQELFDGSLTPQRELSQPDQFLCKERVRLIGPRGVIDNVAVLGPIRPKSQVEISLTDARVLGLQAPVRQSGDLTGSAGIVLASQSGLAGLEEGVIIAARHIHMPSSESARFGVSDGDRVCVLLEGDRPAVFKEVIVRVSDDFRLAMHIDSDEANGCGLQPNTVGRIIKDSLEAGCGLRAH